jgi:hypothetical protein
MMAWYRAAGIAVLFHLAVLVFFTFTFKGAPDAYKIDLIFWGSILRPQEVSSQGRYSVPGPADVKDVDVAAAPRTRLLLWSRGISIDKPDLFKNTVFTVNEDAFRFVGPRVELDEQDAAPRHPENDIPQPAPVKMRWERP